MLAVFSITAPIFILIGLGYFAARIGLLERQQIQLLQLGTELHGLMERRILQKM